MKANRLSSFNTVYTEPPINDSSAFLKTHSGPNQVQLSSEPNPLQCLQQLLHRRKCAKPTNQVKAQSCLFDRTAKSYVAYRPRGRGKFHTYFGDSLA